MSEIIENPYADEAQARWPKQFEESNRRLSRLSRQEQQRIFDAHGVIASQLGDAFRSGAAFDSEEVQELIEQHYKWICNFWEPNAASYRGLADMYLGDPRFAENYNKFAEGLVEFMHQAMHHYASSKLS